jgi:phosphoribosylformylglycinamidine synthase
MINRIEIGSKVADARAGVRKRKLISLGFGTIKNIHLIDVYTIDKDFSLPDLNKIASVLANPVTQISSVNKPLHPANFSCAIETGFLPGVTDNVAGTAKEIIEDLLKIKFKTGEGVYTSRLMFIEGAIGQKDADTIAGNLINPLIQRVHLKKRGQFVKDKGMDRIAPRVKLDKKIKVDTVNLDVEDEELVKIGKMGIKNSDGGRRGPLALDITYMKTIRKYFKKLGRNPTDVELESIAQTWSEHCKHTIFADPIDEIKEGLFKTYIKAATDKIRKIKGKNDFCVSVFKDNSGAIEFDQDYLITHKVETHNSPSALDPYGGAITGICGVNRDAIGFGKGAKPIINTYGFCFADPKIKSPLYKGADFTQKMLSPSRIMTGVIEGVNSGGNCSGIPTPQGFVVFDDRYQGKPLVFVGTVGIIPKKTNGKLNYVKKAIAGDLIVMIGGRVGQDGIHGATFSSEALDSGSPATAVQIGDPITQKKLSDAVVKEARNMNLYNSITDNGAGGLSCSVAEMAKESGGCEVALEKVPLKYPGLEPWKIWVSESQERMTLAVPKNKWLRFSNLMKRRGVEATIIGKFTASGSCLVRYKGKVVMDVDMKFLHDGLPPRPMKTALNPPVNKEPLIKIKANLNQDLVKILSRPNIAGFEFISTQYDHEVQGGSVIKPLQGRGRVNGDTTVVKPVLASKKGVVISQGILPQYSNIDTYHMAASVIDTAIRNAVSTGGNIESLALLDNFCWCSSNDPARLGQLKRAAKACYDCAIGYETPFISGKDSMFNDFKGYDRMGQPIKISVPPTLLVSSIGVIDDIEKTVSIDLKMPGDLIYILGETDDELGGSEYFVMYKAVGNHVPKVDAVKNKKLYKVFYQSVKKGLIASAISVNRGGLTVAIAKTAIAGMLGVDISVDNLPGTASRDDYSLFSESQGRIFVSINPKNKIEFERMIKNHPFALIGKVTDNSRIVIKGKKGKTIIDLDIKKALKAYKKTFKDY